MQNGKMIDSDDVENDSETSFQLHKYCKHKISTFEDEQNTRHLLQNIMTLRVCFFPLPGSDSRLTVIDELSLYRVI